MKLEVLTSNIISKPALDAAYKALQRNECQAVYSSGSELKILTAALAKSGTSYSISTVWNTSAAVQNAEKTVQAKKDEEAKQRLAVKTKLEAQEALNRKMSVEESATARARQEALRTQFGKVAVAFSAAIAKDVRESVDRSDDWQQSAAYAQYPKFVTAYQNLVRNHWELQSFNSDVFDYGQAEWKGRMMETGFALINMRLRNRILGEYKDLCLIAGRMNDAEFSMVRGPTEFACDETAQLSTLNKARNFESQWLVQPQSLAF